LREIRFFRRTLNFVFGFIGPWQVSERNLNRRVPSGFLTKQIDDPSCDGVRSQYDSPAIQQIQSRSLDARRLHLIHAQRREFARHGRENALRHDSLHVAGQPSHEHGSPIDAEAGWGLAPAAFRGGSERLLGGRRSSTTATQNALLAPLILRRIRFLAGEGDSSRLLPPRSRPGFVFNPCDRASMT
jgi:hypothetical protein